MSTIGELIARQDELTGVFNLLTGTAGFLTPGLASIHSKLLDRLRDLSGEIEDALETLTREGSSTDSKSAGKVRGAVTSSSGKFGSFD